MNEIVLKKDITPLIHFASMEDHCIELTRLHKFIDIILTEEITLISKDGVADDTYNKVVEFFGDNGVAQLIMQIIVINSWNRIAVSTKQIFNLLADVAVYVMIAAQDFHGIIVAAGGRISKLPPGDLLNNN